MLIVALLLTHTASFIVFGKEYEGLVGVYSYFGDGGAYEQRVQERFSGVRTTCYRAPSDEASSALSVAQFVLWLSTFLLAWFTFPAEVMLAGLGIAREPLFRRPWV